MLCVTRVCNVCRLHFVVSVVRAGCFVCVSCVCCMTGVCALCGRGVCVCSAAVPCAYSPCVSFFLL